VNYTGKRVFVTGATGFIGSHLVRELIDQGAEVGMLVRSVSREWTFPAAIFTDKGGARWFTGSVQDPGAVSRALNAWHPEIVFHLAAKHSVDLSYYEVDEDFSTNCLGTICVMREFAKQNPEGIFVHMSTSEVYGNEGKEKPINEEVPPSPASPYAASKLAAEAAVFGLARAWGMPRVVVLRCFNVYGPGQSERAIIPRIIRQAFMGKSGMDAIPIRVGNNVVKRDWTYVLDTVKALMLAATRAESVPVGPINIGSGVAYSIQDVIDKVGDIIGRPLVFEKDEKQTRPNTSEVWHLLSDNHKAQETLAWYPSVPFDLGLRKCVEWERHD
jgi:UDP-glucose 4-epimerase